MSKINSGETLNNILSSSLLGTGPDAAIAKKLGVNKVYVMLARQMKGIASYREQKKEKRATSRGDRIEKKIDDLAVAMNALLVELGANK